MTGVTSAGGEYDEQWLTVSSFDSVVFGVRVCDGAKVLLSQALGVIQHQLNFQLLLRPTSMSLLSTDGTVSGDFNADLRVERMKLCSLFL